MSETRPSIDAWLEEIKSMPGSENIGIVFLHVGVARGTTKAGLPVSKVEMTRDPEKLSEVIDNAATTPGVIAVRAWANEGELSVGEDMLCALVAGDTRANTFGAWEDLSRRLKADVIEFQES